MRVIFLAHNYPRFAGDVAGNFLHPLAASLVVRGHDVRVIAPSDRGKGGEESLDGVGIRRIRYAIAEQETLAYRGTMGAALRSPAGIRALAGMIRAFTKASREESKGSSDVVVHAHWWVPAGLATPSELPLVVTCHGTDVRILAASRSFGFFGRRVLRRAKVVTTVSTMLARIIEQESGVAIGPDAIRPMPVMTVERPLSTGGGIVMLGRLTEQKRIDLALEAFSKAMMLGLDLPITIIGDGQERARLTSRVTELGLDKKVSFVGAVPPDEVPGYLSRADLSVMTAKDEGLGLAAAEALIQGVPVLACEDGGGLLDVVQAGKGGMVVPPTPDALARGVVEMLSNKTFAAEAALAGQDWAFRLHPDSVAERAEIWYRRALEK